MNILTIDLSLLTRSIKYRMYKGAIFSLKELKTKDDAERDKVGINKV